MTKRNLTIFALLTIIITLFILNHEKEIWPEPTGHTFSRLGSERAKTYIKQDLNAQLRTQEYSAAGDYLNFSKTKSFSETSKLTRDAEGLPMVRYGNEFQYNAVTLSQYALTAHGKYLAGAPKDELITAADKLVTMQREDGAFPYDFSYRHYTAPAPYRLGWISGMAQGQALSALSRAYLVTQDERYLEAGNKSLNFLNVPREDGGPRTSMADLHPSLSEYVFYMEYVADPAVYTLNGFMFTLIGLYDWWQNTGSSQAKSDFKNGLKTLVKILPYYDLDTFTAYDMSYVTHARPKWLEPIVAHSSVGYHAVHIYQLYALDSIAPDDTLKYYFNKWSSYIEPDTVAVNEN